MLKTLKKKKKKQWSAEDANTRVEHSLQRLQSNVKADLQCFVISVSVGLCQRQRRVGQTRHHGARRGTRAANTSSPLVPFACLDVRLWQPRPPHIHSTSHQRWQLTQMSMLISVGACGVFPHILNICDILKHWLVHRGNYKIIITIMTCSSYQMPGCLTTAWFKDVEIL